MVRFSEDDMWYRGVIMHIRIPEGNHSKRGKPISSYSEFEYYVLHVDFGSSEWVTASKVRPVADKFFDLPMETLLCCLADIQPMGKLVQRAFTKFY